MTTFPKKDYSTWTPLNAEQTEALFMQYAIQIDGYDVVPRSVVMDLFDRDAIDHACSRVKYHYLSASMLELPDGGKVWYITHTGFKYCVSYANARAIQEREQANHEREWAIIERIDQENAEAREQEQTEAPKPRRGRPRKGVVA